jgi:hypothetical protein
MNLTLPERLANAVFVVALLAMGVWFYWTLLMEASR